MNWGRGLFLCLGLSACSSLSPETRDTAETFSFDSATLCPAIQDVLKSADKGFADQRKGASSKLAALQVWEAGSYGGADCQVLQWGDNKVNYSCNKRFNGPYSAANWHSALNSSVKSCLGDGWKKREGDEREGKITIWQTDSTANKVAVRYFRDEKAISDSAWKGAIAVGKAFQTAR